MKLATLQLMFSNDGNTLKKDDGNQEYLDAMPQSANLGLSMVTGAGVPLLGKLHVAVDPAAEAVSLEGDVLRVPVTPGGVARVDMRACCKDYRALCAGEIYREADGAYGAAESWSVEGRDTLVLAVDSPCAYTVYYRAYPTKITDKTPDETEINVPREAAELVPLLMASQLYRDDDIQMSTQMRNEFEDGLAKLQIDNGQRPAGGSGAVRNTTGWW